MNKRVQLKMPCKKNHIGFAVLKHFTGIIQRSLDFRWFFSDTILKVDILFAVHDVFFMNTRPSSLINEKEKTGRGLESGSK